MNIASFELSFIAAFIALTIYLIKMCIMDGLATKLSQQINRENILRGELEEKIRTLMDLETQIVEIDKQHERLNRDINSKKEQLEADHNLFKSLVDKQNHISLHIQREKETMLIKEEEYKQDMIKIEQQAELRKAQFISKVSLYNKEIDAYNEQEAALKKIIATLAEEKVALKTMKEIERARAQKLKDIEESTLLLADLSTMEEKINADIRKKLSAINSKLVSPTFLDNNTFIEEQVVNLTTNDN
jgi:chromosome segregation ATPase